MKETNPKPFVFVLMPFGGEFTEIYKLGIKPACESAGAYCERVDEQFFHESILVRIYNQIAKADIIVSDMTGRNPNVFYETGYAHALNKQVILLTQNAYDIPFDLKHYPHIVYSGKIIPLHEQLQPRVRWCVENPRDVLSSVDINLEFLINKHPLINKPQINLRMNEKTWGKAISLTIGIHNSGQRVIEPDSFSLSLVLPEPLDYEPINTISSVTRLADDNQILNLQLASRLFPGSWFSLYVPCRLATNKLSSLTTNQSIELLLRLFTELGPKDFPFVLKLQY